MRIDHPGDNNPTYIMVEGTKLIAIIEKFPSHFHESLITIKQPEDSFSGVFLDIGAWPMFKKLIEEIDNFLESQLSGTTDINT
jgi:hypothetical protein